MESALDARPLSSPRTAWLAVVLAIAGCATSATAGPGGAGGSDGGAVNKDVPCSPGMPCGLAKTCVNGLCAAGCNSDADCGPTQYCELTNGQVCLDKTLAACPATPCAPTQVCIDGLCGTVPTGNPCAPNPFGGDGCQKDQLCLKDVTVDGVYKTDGVCYVLPLCSAEHPCSPGGGGALCSTAFIMGKTGMCIPGACATDQNCPASWKCIPGVMMSGYGECSNGAAGQPCGKTADCKPGLQCHIPVVNQLGTCK